MNLDWHRKNDRWFGPMLTILALCYTAFVIWLAVTGRV